MRIKLLLMLMMALLVHVACGQQIPVNPPPEAVSLASAAFSEYDTGYTVDQRVASAKPNSTILIPETFDPRPGGEVFNPNGNASLYPPKQVRFLTATSDLIGTGIPIRRWSYLTSDKHFAFSIYLVQVTEAIWSGTDHVTQGGYVYIARTGGILNYRGHKIIAFDPEFQFFHLNNEYMFFGHRVGDGLFKVDSEHTLLLKDDLVSETTTHVHHPDTFRNVSKNQLLADVHTAAQLLKQSDRRPQ